tara:strand:+ start:548 stop:820 length:273 start_codon:yes stop_codon:yes gene_type:complete
MARILTLILICCCLSSTAQYKKRKKSKLQVNTKILTVVGGTTLITAGTVSMVTKGEKPFVNNKTKWKISPSEWAIIGGFTAVTFGIIYKF